MQNITSIKIYGERNSGTNYVSELLAKNFDVYMMPGTVSLSPSQIWLLECIGRLSEMKKKIVREYLRDRYFRLNFDKTLGWKHMRVEASRVAGLLPEGVGYVALIKHPYSWALSLFRHPYNSFSVPTRDFTQFLSTPFPMYGRDTVSSNALRPMEIWNQKVTSYYELASLIKPTAVLQYEDFLRDEVAQIVLIAEALNLALPTEMNSVQNSTKDRSKTQEDYRQYYLSEHWREEMSKTDQGMMSEQLDRELVERCGYEIV